MEKITIALTRRELDLLVEALDSHAYWQLADDEYKNNGFVYEPGSDDPEKAEEIRESEILGECLSKWRTTLPEVK